MFVLRSMLTYVEEDEKMQAAIKARLPVPSE